MDFGLALLFGVGTFLGTRGHATTCFLASSCGICYFDLVPTTERSTLKNSQVARDRTDAAGKIAMTSNVRRGNSGFATVADRPSLASSRAHGVPRKRRRPSPSNRARC